MFESLPLIADPWFWVVAVLAVLLTGLVKSGFASGFSGIGVPLMAMAIPVPQAAAIMLPLLMVMDATGLQQLWRDRDPKLVRRLLPAGLVGVVAGTLLFGVLSAKAVAGVVGAMTWLSGPATDHATPPGRATPAAWAGGSAP